MHTSLRIFSLLSDVRLPSFLASSSLYFHSLYAVPTYPYPTLPPTFICFLILLAVFIARYALFPCHRIFCVSTQFLPLSNVLSRPPSTLTTFLKGTAQPTIVSSLARLSRISPTQVPLTPPTASTAQLSTLSVMNSTTSPTS